MPVDILTDAMVNSSEAALVSDRSSRKSAAERRANRHTLSVGETQDPEVKELLRIASESASRERKITTPRAMNAPATTATTMPISIKNNFMARSPNVA